MNYDKEYPRTTTAGAMAFDAHLIMEKEETAVRWIICRC